MRVKTLTVGPIDVNCYIVRNNADKALIIDPGWDADRILGAVESGNLSIAAYLITHGHVDHVCALADMYDAHPAPVAIHRNDLSWAFKNENQMPPLYPVPGRPASIERILEDGQEWTDGGLRYQVIYTPGHTPGGVCFHFPEENVLFTGDTLFAGSVGRTDLPGSDADAMTRSLKRLSELPDNTTIYPGHGPVSTMKREKKTNFFLQHL